MKKKYNDESDKFADWTTKKLKYEAKAYHDLIYRSECYGMSDMKNYSGICRVLDERGISITSQIDFE